MKRARADGDSDAEDPGAPPDKQGNGRQEDEEEEDEAEYFRQAVGAEPDEGVWLESWESCWGPGLLLTPCTPTPLTDISSHRHVPHC